MLPFLNQGSIIKSYLGLATMQEGIVRTKLAKLLKGYDDVRYEDSIATGEGIKAVSYLLYFFIGN